LAALLCLFAVSCEKELTEAEKEQQKLDEQLSFWDVVGQLVSFEDYTDEYEEKTFEPTYGTPESEGSLTRIVNTNDMRTAAARFANLVGRDDIDANTPSFTFRDENIGTLTYNRVNDGSTWATVDVSIRQIPHLEKIIYRLPGTGDNGHFEGRAYYRFGDIIKRTLVENNAERVEYWICVRPAFGPEGKEDSHWVCINSLPADNLIHVHGSNGIDYYVPTRLGTDKEHMQNFAEMMWAIFRPYSWWENCIAYYDDGWFSGGLPIFNDFTKENLKYHNEYFWKDVQFAWNDTPEVANALGGVMPSEISRRIESEGITLLYKGYSWSPKTSWDLKLWEASYNMGEKNGEKNLHLAAYTTPKKNVSEIQFDCRNMGSMLANYNGYFGDGKLRWIIRNATGAELSSTKKADIRQPLDGDWEEVYRYYSYYPVKSLLSDPEETIDRSKYVQNSDGNGGTFMIGDVVSDGQGNRWFCILGSPHHDTFFPMVEDHNAWFVSFDGFTDNGKCAQDLPTLDEAIEGAMRFCHAVYALRNFNMVKFKLGGGLTNPNLGAFGDHIQKYTGINLLDLMVQVDSTWSFMREGNRYTSSSTSSFFSIAYDDGSKDHQALLQCIIDMTQCGNYRGECFVSDENGTRRYDTHQYRFYTNYESYDPSRMTEITPDWRTLGISLWQWYWAIDKKQMLLQDITDQALVNRYAAHGKWAGKPLAMGDGTYNRGPRHQVRTEASKGVSPSEYYAKNGGPGTRVGMWNEPVLFMKFMKVQDMGQNVIPQESVDGRSIRVVHMQDNATAYKGGFQCNWVNAYPYAAHIGTFVNNDRTIMPELPGMPYDGPENY